jgi:hypothetical protein
MRRARIAGSLVVLAMSPSARVNRKLTAASATE